MTSQEPGTEIAGYRIESLIGRGGMAVVYRAEDMRLGRKVALKLLTPQLANSDEFRKRFIRESRLAASLDHPNIVPIYEAGEANGQLFIAMRYVLGRDLKAQLAEEGGQLPLRWTLPLFGQIGDALASAHRAGLVHRDVKPANILIATGEGPRAHGDHVYLTDFGLTKRTSELSGGLTNTGHFLGTVDYVSPEQIQGKPVGPGTDIYALGCVLFECLTGQLPFRRDDDAGLLWAHLVETAPPVTGIRTDLPVTVNAVVARAMAKDPADRYQTCDDLLLDLQQALEASTAVPTGWTTGDRSPATSRDGEPDAESDGEPDTSRDGGPDTELYGEPDGDRDSEATGLPQPTPRPVVGGYSLAIDLGTSFIAAAVADDHGLEMFTLGDGSLVSPAAVYVTGDGRVMTGEAAARRAVSHPDRVAREVKRQLGNPTPLMLGGAPYAVSDLLGALLQDVLVRVTERQGAKAEVVALTHPANWGPFRSERFQDVARSAGLDEPLYTTEPEAAAAHYASTRPLGEGEVLAVYDLGGGTFDATVLRRTAQGFEILGTPEGIERLGGADFDDAIFAHVNYLAGGALSELDLSDPRTVVALARLHQDCTLAKEALSVDAEATIPVFLPNRHFEVTLTRTELEGMIRASIESTIGTLDRVIRAAQVDRTTLAAVLLAGGSSRIPLVAQMVSEAFGRPTVVGAHPKHSVALGAALLAEARRRETTDAPLLGTDAGWTGVGGDGPDVPGPRAAPVSPAPSLGAWNGVAAAPVPATTSIPASGPALAEAVAASAVLPTGAGASEVTDGDHGGGPASVVPPPRTGKHSGEIPGGTGQRSPPDDGTPPVVPSPSGAARKRPVALIAGLLLLGLAAVAVVLYLTLRPATQTPAATSGQPPAATSATGASAGQTPAPPAVASAVPIPSLGTAIDVGLTPNFVVASPSGHQLYVANTNAGVVTVVDTAVNRVTGTIPIKAGPPRFLAFSADGRNVYVSVWDDARTIAAISVLDTTTNTIVNTVPVHTRPFLAAVSHDGRFVYVPNHDTGTVEVIDGATNRPVTEFSVPANPHSVFVTPDGKKLYIADHESNVVSVVDTSSNTVVTQIPVPQSPHNVAVHPTRPLAVVASFDADSVTVIDTNTDTKVSTVPVGHQPQHVAYSADGRFAYITNDGDNSVSVLSLDTLAVTGVIPTGPSPTSMAVLPDGRTGYVSDFGGTTLTVLNLAG